MRNETIANVKKFLNSFNGLVDSDGFYYHYNDKLKNGWRSVKLTTQLEYSQAELVAKAIETEFGYKTDIVSASYGSSMCFVRFYYEEKKIVA